MFRRSMWARRRRMAGGRDASWAGARSPSPPARASASASPQTRASSRISTRQSMDGASSRAITRLNWAPRPAICGSPRRRVLRSERFLPEGDRLACVERGAHPPGQFRAPVGLWQDWKLGAAPARRTKAGVTRGEEHFKAGPATPRRMRQIDTVHLIGHHHVGEEQLNTLVVLDDPQRRMGIDGRQNFVAEILHHFDHKLEHKIVVLDDEYGLMPL